MAKTQRIHRDKNAETGVVTFTVTENGTVLPCDVRQVFPDFDKMNDVQKHAVIHAVNAKVGDSAASKDVDALEAMTKTWEQLVAGEWNARGEGGGGGSKTTMLAEALARVSGKEMEAVNEKLGGMSDEEKADLRAHPAVKAAMAEIKLERQKVAAKKAKEGAKDSALEF